ncbi:MAG: phosphate ABC transporter substrate-binding/OmpA family protein [Methylococcaceae bacterium]|nr:phosphate ABC transporter substrate-binding/OmpA family protein [Methylococcaceae bacterium]
MSIHVRLALVLLILGSAAMVGSKFLLPWWQDRQSKTLSDARTTKGQIGIGIDNWVGYFPLCSAEMKRRMRQQGYLLQCHEDRADYAQRLKDLAEGKIQLAVATVDSFVLNGLKQNYPGTIIAVLDESKGGDALVAWRDRLNGLEDLRQLDQIRIAFTPASPSEHLLKALSVHFDIAALRQPGPWRVEADGSPDALRRLLAREVDAAVLWEPDVSRALKERGVHRLLGTEQTRQLIVDVLIARRELTQNQPELVETLLDAYFNTLKEYRDHPDGLREQVQQSTGLKPDEVDSLLKGVEWQSLADNARRWFGLLGQGTVREEALIDTIEASVGILRDFGSLAANPLPAGDPYRLTNSAFVGKLYRDRQTPEAVVAPAVVEPGFPPLTEEQWDRLQEVGTLKIRPIVFASGSDQLTLADKTQLDNLAENLRHYPDFRIRIRGHTGLRGEEQANRQLSQDRAEAIARYLSLTHGLPEPRMLATGYGSARPLPRLPGESERAYAYRLPRVEIVLVADSL